MEERTNAEPEVAAVLTANPFHTSFDESLSLSTSWQLGRKKRLNDTAILRTEESKKKFKGCVLHLTLMSLPTTPTRKCFTVRKGVLQHHH